MLDLVKDNLFKNQIEGIMSVAGVVTCIMGGILILKNAHNYIISDSIDLLDIFKPLLFVGLVCNFDTFILGPLDALTNIIMGMLGQLFGNPDGSYTSEWEDNISTLMRMGAATQQEAYEAEMAELANENFFVRHIAAFFLSIKKFLLSFTGAASLTFSALVGGILFIIAKVAIFVQQLLSCIFYVLNGMTGPFSLALSTLPSFGSAFRDWVGRQVQIAMWVPLGFLVMGINLEISRVFIDIGAQEGVGLGAEWLMIGLQVATLISIFCIPKMATWFIPASGISDVHRSMVAPARMMAMGAAKL